MNHTEFDALLEAILAGKTPLPAHIEHDDPAVIIDIIQRMHGPIYQPYQIMVDGRPVYYPKVFTRLGGMGAKFTGEGLVLSAFKAYEFRMCDHEWDTSGANPMRGWHPKRCTKCGFNASIDSGD